MKLKILKSIATSIFVLCASLSMAQTATISGKITAEGKPLEFANVVLLGTTKGAVTDTMGVYKLSNLQAGNYLIRLTCIGYKKMDKTISIKNEENLTLNFDLSSNSNALNEVVITGTMKEVSRSQSPVPVEVYTPPILKKIQHQMFMKRYKMLMVLDHN